jgi:NDP-sugar pyrophosphorylase family protein
VRAVSPGPKLPDQAVILAAGRSTRLRPLTTDLPKCMVPVGDRPLIGHTIEYLRSYGVVNIVINLHHAGDRIVEYLGDGRAFGVNVGYSPEPSLLGTAGGVRRAARSFDGPFFVWYGDNLSTIRLDDLWRAHQRAEAEATVALYQREDTSQSGVAEVDHSGRIRRFIEKPKPGQAAGNWVSAGIFVLEHSVVGAIAEGEFSDFGAQVFPELIERDAHVNGYLMSKEEELWWVDTPHDLARSRAAFGNGIVRESRGA